MDHGYYVYRLSLHDGTPFYIGKGKGRRINDHGTSRGRLVQVNAVFASLAANGQECLRVIVQAGLTEDQAYAIERRLIVAIGRVPTGPLVNLNDGGWGGRNPSQGTREKISQAAIRQEKQPREHMLAMNAKRGPWTEDQRRKLSASLAGKPKSPEHRHALSASKKSSNHRSSTEHLLMMRVLRGGNSPETREKLRAANLGKKYPPEFGAKISARQVGVAQSPISNARRSATLKGRPKTPEHLAAIAAAWAAKRTAKGLS